MPTAFSQNSQRLLDSSLWQFRNAKENKWYPATVPGTVHTDLLTNKRIPDPFYGANENDLQWIENESWEYTSAFSLSKGEMKHSHIELEFDGLDTYAKVYFNDSLILSADNMFRKWNTDIKKYARKGRNTLRIVFEPATLHEKEEAKKLAYTLPSNERVFSRKAPYQYGWDWGPRFVTCGIWKSVKLRFWDKAVIRDMYCVQKSLTDSLARLSRKKTRQALLFILSSMVFLFSLCLRSCLP
jgi:beta-mannosidase